MCVSFHLKLAWFASMSDQQHDQQARNKQANAKTNAKDRCVQRSWSSTNQLSTLLRTKKGVAESSGAANIVGSSVDSRLVIPVVSSLYLK
jgi:hypothetical protein